MPNHVTTWIIGDPGLLAHMLPEKDRVDFGTVIPEPAENDPQFTATRHEHPGLGVSYSMDGRSIMDWRREQWGTKWNGYETEVHALPGDLMLLKFETAWSHPFPVVEALSLLGPPTETYRVLYADEDTGSNCGEYTIRNGELTWVREFPVYGPESCDFASMVCYGQTYAEMSASWE